MRSRSVSSSRGMAAAPQLSRDDEANRAGEPIPALELTCELLSAGSRQRVDLRFTAGVGGGPRGLQPALLLQPVQRRVQRALRDLQHVAADLANALRDAPAVHRLERERLEDEQIQRALNEIGRSAHGDTQVTDNYA